MKTTRIISALLSCLVVLAVLAAFQFKEYDMGIAFCIGWLVGALMGCAKA